uniref:Uncharacterized protein n=1 Tax=Ixodes ricinus TaxID=34613 RepID=A0A6B0V4F8_IXORI
MAALRSRYRAFAASSASPTVLFLNSAIHASSLAFALSRPSSFSGFSGKSLVPSSFFTLFCGFAEGVASSEESAESTEKSLSASRFPSPRASSFFVGELEAGSCFTADFGATSSSSEGSLVFLVLYVLFSLAAHLASAVPVSCARPSSEVRSRIPVSLGLRDELVEALSGCDPALLSDDEESWACPSWRVDVSSAAASPEESGLSVFSGTFSSPTDCFRRCR